MDSRFAPQHVPPAYNPDLARELLEQAGYPDGIDITLHTADVGPGMIEMAVAFQRGRSARRHSGRRPASNLQMGSGKMCGWSCRSPWFIGPVSWWTNSWSSSTRATPPGMRRVTNNPTYDELLIKARGQDLEGQKRRPTQRCSAF